MAHCDRGSSYPWRPSGTSPAWVHRRRRPTAAAACDTKVNLAPASAAGLGSEGIVDANQADGLARAFRAEALERAAGLGGRERVADRRDPSPRALLVRNKNVIHRAHADASLPDPRTRGDTPAHTYTPTR